MQKKITTLFFLSLLSCNLHATAMNLTKQKFSLNASLGYVTGTAEEFVYDPNQNGALLSHLVWKMEGVPIVRAHGNYQINSWLEAGVGGWINLKIGEGLLDDYDWLPPITVFEMWSHHTDTKVKQASEADIHLKGWLLQKSNYKLGALVGYQRNLYSFIARGGCFNYYFGAYVGCFPAGEAGIGYKQTFNMPYLGVAGQLLINNWDFSGLFKFSNQVSARDIDQHYQRALTFYEGSNKFKYYNASLNAGYFIKPQLKLFTEASYNYIPNKKITSTMVDNLNDFRIDFPDSAGLSNQNYMLSVGVQFSGWDS